jgi:hypothetical protein
LDAATGIAVATIQTELQRNREGSVNHVIFACLGNDVLETYRRAGVRVA